MLQALNQYANLINFAFLISIVGWLFLLTRNYKDAIAEKFEAKLASKDMEIQSLSDRLSLVENQLEYQKENSTERLVKTQEDLERTEKWYEREVVRLRQELSDALEQGEITKEQLVMNIDTSAISAELRGTITEVLKEITNLEQEVKKENEVIDDPNLFIEMAKAFTSSDRWLEAAENYGKYLVHFPEDWEVHFLRGVALVNTRQGAETNLAALRSYNEAIAYAPYSIEDNMRARLFAYRGAVSKRLYRLDEAEADLLLAKKFATADYEVHDIKYNLAAVYAMKGEKSKMLDMIKELRFTEILSIRAHLNDYFADFANDEEFLQAIK